MLYKHEIIFRFPVESEELFWLDAEARGVVSNIYAIIEEDGANINFSAYTPGRLELELRLLAEQGLDWIDKANILILPKITRKNVESAIARFFKQFRT